MQGILGDCGVHLLGSSKPWLEEADQLAQCFQRRAKEDSKRGFKEWCAQAVQQQGGKAAHAFVSGLEKVASFPEEMLKEGVLYSTPQQQLERVRSKWAALWTRDQPEADQLVAAIKELRKQA
eukprot:11199506-Lingulodinium_polyedra.AAC.1